MKPQIRFMNQKWLCIIQFDQLRGTNNGIASWLWEVAKVCLNCNIAKAPRHDR